MSTPVYHITHLDNLISILAMNGLLANSAMQQQSISYKDLAYQSIQARFVSARGGVRAVAIASVKASGS